MSPNHSHSLDAFAAEKLAGLEAAALRRRLVVTARRRPSGAAAASSRSPATTISALPTIRG